MNLQPRAITAFFVGLKSRFDTFKMQRRVNTYAEEPLLAILPGVALHELWSLMGTASALSVILYSSSWPTSRYGDNAGGEPQRTAPRNGDVRSVGARPHHVLRFSSSRPVSVFSVCSGGKLLYAGMITLLPVIESRYGLFIPINPLSINDWMYLGVVVAAGILAGIAPAIAAVRMSLADGMVVRS